MNEIIPQQTPQGGETMTMTEQLATKPLSVLMQGAQLVLDGDDKQLVQQYNDALGTHVDGARHESDDPEQIQLGKDLRDLRADLATRFAKLNGVNVGDRATSVDHQKPQEGSYYKKPADDPLNNWPMKN